MVDCKSIAFSYAIERGRVRFPLRVRCRAAKGLPCDHNERQYIMTAKNVESTEVAIVDDVVASASAMDVAGIVAGMSSGDLQMYTSVKGVDKVAKLKVLDAITNSEPLADHLRESFNLTDFVIQVIQMADEKTGEIGNVPRIILIMDDGKAYHAISSGVLQSLRNFVGVLGEPGTGDAWPVAVTCDEVKGRNGYRFMTLKLA